MEVKDIFIKLYGCLLWRTKALDIRREEERGGKRGGREREVER